MRWPWGEKPDSELEREVSHHLEALADSYVGRGYSREEALRLARRDFGAVEQVKEECRDERRWRWLAQIAQDLAFGARMMRKTPAVTAAAVFSLALGIGAVTAIVSLMDAVLWRDLAVPEPRQLTQILWQSKSRPEKLFRGSSGSMHLDGRMQVADFFSRNAFDALRDKMAGRLDVAAHLESQDVSTSYGGVPTVAKLRPVSGNFFPMLGVRPLAGRLLTPADDNSAAPPTVVVSHTFWRASLGGSMGVIGSTLNINSRAYTISGVLPRSFGGITAGDATDLYTPLALAPVMLAPDSWERKATVDPTAWFIQLLARRLSDDPGLVAAAQAAFRSTWVAEPGDEAQTPTLRFEDASTGIGSLRREFGNPFTVLLVLVAFVLTIACANIANLMLARADTRRKEVALRVSLGCSRARLVRQFFTESVLLAVAGGLASLLVTYATANFAVTLMPGDLRLQFGIDARMLLATLVVTAFTAVAFGLYPAWRAANMDSAPALKEGAGSVGGVNRGTMSPGRILVLGQVALGVALVAAGAAFTAHLRKILSSETGFERTRLLLFDVRPGESGYREDKLRQFYLAMEQRLKSVPGVRAAGVAHIRPMMGGGYHDDIRIPGHPKWIAVAVNFVTAGYLDALGVPVVAGRGIDDRDIRARAPVAVVSENIARQIGRSPLGLSFQIDGRTVEIVGIVAQARYSRLTQQPVVVYLPHALDRDSATFLLRTSVPPMRLVESVRAAAAEIDPNLPLVRLVSMEDQIAQTLQRERLFAWLCGAFGVLALLLCMTGLYGVMSYATARRRQEVGIRMALGASRMRVLRHVIAEGVGLAAAGCAVGLPLAWWAAQRYIDYKRLGINPLDIPVLALAALALTLSALVAVLGPAWRAAAADPMTALREG